MEISYFTPGQIVQAGPPLACYRPPALVGALQPYLQAYTQPGDLVIDLFCQGPTLINEITQAGRRALGLNVNRVLLLAASLELTTAKPHQVQAAFTHLATTRKGPNTLQAHIEGLYRTTCAACGSPVTADAFIWERDGDAPIAKHYHCATCNEARETPTNQADRADAARFAPKGLSYWLMLDRAASIQAPHRGRLASLLELYTPRNLTALSDLLLKADGQKLSPPIRRILDALLLDTLDQASSLRPPTLTPLEWNVAMGHSRPYRLARPARYVEWNVWRLFEHALQAWRTLTPTPIARAANLDTLLAAGSEALAYLAPLAAHQAGRALPHACASLIIVEPPRPDLTLWRLSALWSSWLRGRWAGAALEPFVRQRRLDWDWFWRGLRGAFESVALLLQPHGRLVCLWTDENPALLETLTLAGAGAGYQLAGWSWRPPGEGRLVWRFKPQAAPAVSLNQVSRAVSECIAESAQHTLHTRGEPLAWPRLHAAAYMRLAQKRLLAQAACLPTHTQPLKLLADSARAALNGAPLRQITAPQANGEPAQILWWLDQDLEAQAAAPLNDRVELAVAAILRGSLAVCEAELARQVCQQFPEQQTPDARLIRLCLFSYGDEHAPGHWRLRAEDVFEARVAETDAMLADLERLGRRLGFTVEMNASSASGVVVRWLDQESPPPFTFVVRSNAVLGDLLFNPPGLTASQTTPCLVLPGGRAILVGYKLRHDPRLRQQVQRWGWQFLKFRHLRHLVRKVTAKQLDRFAFQAALGLDPIVEQSQAQMSLW